MPISPFNPKRIRPETSVPRYRSDGTGRDYYRIGDLNKNPNNSVLIVQNKRDPEHKKIVAIPTSLPKFSPSGTGRDLFQQCNSDPVVAHTSYHFSERPPVNSKQGLGVNRQNLAPPIYRPDGSGRDLFIVDRPTTCAASIRLDRIKKSAKLRTPSMPRFLPTGTGRDTYQGNTISSDNSLTSNWNAGIPYGNNSIFENSKKPLKKVLNKYNERYGLTTNYSIQQKSIDRLCTSPTRLQNVRRDYSLYSTNQFTRMNSPIIVSHMDYTE